MLMNDIQKQAMPYLKGRAIQDLVVGVSLIAVQLDDGSIGVSYVLRESLPGGCSVFPYAREAVGMSAEEALFEVDNFLSRAIMAGLPSVTVIHGKGTGVLRNAVQQHLRSNKRVKSVRSGVYGEGEQGVTIVELR